MKRVLFVAIVVLLAFCLVSPLMAEGKKEKADDGKLKFGYISKMLTHPWFIQESQGIEDKCEELGVEYVAIDANQDNEQFMQAFENLIARGADAILFCITDPQLGPTVADRAEEAGIPIMTIDDNIVDSNGDPVPHVGMPTTEVGYQGGKALAKEAKERGFMEPGNNVKVMSVTVSFKTFLLERTQGYHKALKEELPSIPDENYIMEDNKTGMFEDVLPVASSILNANPDATHWIVTGINDDSAIAPLRVFEENGFPLENVIACGLGGYKLSLEEFQKDHNSYIVNKTQPHEEGVQAAQLMYDHIVNDKELPEVTYVPGVIVTKENYKDFDWSM